jgi:predicted Zn-dependent protease
LLKQAKFFRDAWDALQQAVARDPKNISLKADLIRVDAEIDRVNGAILRAQEFARGDPDHGLYDQVSAELYERAGRAPDAVALFEKVLAARPADNDLAVALSRLYTRMGEFGKAEAALTLTSRPQTGPKNIAISSALAPLYLMIGRPDDARKVYEGILSQRPNDVAALSGLAHIAAGEKQWPGAIDYIQRARDAAPNDPAPGLKNPTLRDGP